LSASAQSKAGELPTSCVSRYSLRIHRGLTPAPGKLTSRPTFASLSASAVPIPPAAVELLTALAPVLNRWGRWYLFGAQAVIAHGFPRLSADVDVTLELSPDDPDSFARDMTNAGFSLRVTDSDFVRRTRVMPFVHRATAMPLDIVLAGSGLEDEFLSRAQATNLHGTPVPLIDFSDLIIAKVLAGRPKDLADAAGLWQLRGHTADADRIRAVLRLLEEALNQSDLIPVFESFAAKADQSTGEPND